MPLTEKGRKILASLIRQHGKAKGTEIFYKMQNSGKAIGVHKRKK